MPKRGNTSCQKKYIKDATHVSECIFERACSISFSTSKNKKSDLIKRHKISKSTTKIRRGGKNGSGKFQVVLFRTESWTSLPFFCKRTKYFYLLYISKNLLHSFSRLIFEACWNGTPSRESYNLKVDRNTQRKIV